MHVCYSTAPDGRVWILAGVKKALGPQAAAHRVQVERVQVGRLQRLDGVGCSVRLQSYWNRVCLSQIVQCESIHEPGENADLESSKR